MCEGIYMFQERDIAMNMCIQIRAVVDQIRNRLHITFEEAMMLFYNSKTYGVLENTENTLWAEASEYIVDCFFEEYSQS